MKYKIKFNKEDYDYLQELIEENSAENKIVGHSVAVCNIIQTGFLQYSGDMELLEVIDNVDLYDDCENFFIVKNKKAFLIYEATAFDNYKEFRDYIIGMGDVHNIATEIKELEGKVDWFVTSNENMFN